MKKRKAKNEIINNTNLTTCTLSEMTFFTICYIDPVRRWRKAYLME